MIATDFLDLKEIKTNLDSCREALKRFKPSLSSLQIDSPISIESSGSTTEDKIMNLVSGIGSTADSTPQAQSSNFVVLESNSFVSLYDKLNHPVEKLLSILPSPTDLIWINC